MYRRDAKMELFLARAENCEPIVYLAIAYHCLADLAHSVSVASYVPYVLLCQLNILFFLSLGRIDLHDIEAAVSHD